jgi:hypothetical protein
MPQGFIYLYDTTPFVITNGRIAANVPCEDNSTASLKVLIGQTPNVTNSELENVRSYRILELCLYHVDIPPQNLRIFNICLYIGNDIELIPVYTTIC